VAEREYNCEEDSFFNRIDFCNETEREEQFIKELINLKAQQKGGEQIAILVRENKQVEHIRKLCSQNGIYVYTDVGGDLYRIRPTIDLYKLMLALQNNKNPVYLYNLFTTSYVSESLPKLMIYKCKGKKEKLLKWFNTSKVLERWDEYVSEIKREPAMKVIKSIINDVKPWINYAGEAELDEEKRRRQVYYKRNLEEVLEKLISMTNTDYLSINKIQKTLEIMILTKQDEEQREYDSDYNKDEKIVCMTIHKAKGLEFHTVIMPYCQAELAGERKTGYVDLIVEGETEQGKDIKYNIGYKLTFRKAKRSGSVITKNNYYDNYLENERFYRKQEETRLLYVAMTRAIKRFFYFHQRKCREQDNWQALISKGLGEGL
jgi:DNA helicase-2/ATP-dependent DNA helicase PcrA